MHNVFLSGIFTLHHAHFFVQSENFKQSFFFPIVHNKSRILTWQPKAEKRRQKMLKKLKKEEKEERKLQKKLEKKEKKEKKEKVLFV